ncbi:MAG TPA: shikimate dehydrogenase [Nitrososphaeraceae archaeon]|nr:shikimate dehydrogenase [Nitrososphaeraceae archaeon]
MQNKHSSRTYCIIGDPIQHSLSSAMQNAAFNAAGLNCSYIAFRVKKGELKESIKSLRAIGVSGFNITVPHKVEAMKYLDGFDSSARRANAVNTVHNMDGVLKAYNTDIYGFIHPLHLRKVNFDGMKVLLIGAGGAARAILAALADENGISEVNIANRSEGKARALLEISSALRLNCKIVPWERIPEYSRNTKLIVNATTVGMNNEPSLVKHEDLNKDAIVYDIVYKPVNTDFLEDAKHAGANVIYGYEMLLYQGAKSFEIWTGMSAPIDAMKKALLGTLGEPS